MVLRCVLDADVIHQIINIEDKPRRIDAMIAADEDVKKYKEDLLHIHFAKKSKKKTTVDNTKVDKTKKRTRKENLDSSNKRAKVGIETEKVDDADLSMDIEDKRKISLRFVDDADVNDNIEDRPALAKKKATVDKTKIRTRDENLDSTNKRAKWSSDNEEISGLRSRLVEKEKENQVLQDENKNLQEENKNLQKNNKNLQKKNQNLKEENQNLYSQVARLKAQLQPRSLSTYLSYSGSTFEFKKLYLTTYVNCNNSSISNCIFAGLGLAFKGHFVAFMYDNKSVKLFYYLHKKKYLNIYLLATYLS